MPGRKPMGPQLVHHLDGSELAKERLEIILESIAEKRTIEDACEHLGISEAMFFRLRMQVLQAGLARLEPRPAGRPSQSHSPEEERIAKLEEELREKQSELKAAEVMPQLVQDEGLKKTTQRKQRRKPATKRQRRRRK